MALSQPTGVRCNNTGLWKPECSCADCLRELMRKHAPPPRHRTHDRRSTGRRGQTFQTT